MMFHVPVPTHVHQGTSAQATSPDTREADRVIRNYGACDPANSGGWMVDGPGFIHVRVKVQYQTDVHVICFVRGDTGVGTWLFIAPDGVVWKLVDINWVPAKPEDMPQWLRDRQVKSGNA